MKEIILCYKNWVAISFSDVISLEMVSRLSHSLHFCNHGLLLKLNYFIVWEFGVTHLSIRQYWPSVPDCSLCYLHVFRANRNMGGNQYSMGWFVCWMSFQICATTILYTIFNIWCSIVWAERKRDISVVIMLFSKICIDDGYLVKCQFVHL